MPLGHISKEEADGLEEMGAEEDRQAERAAQEGPQLTPEEVAARFARAKARAAHTTSAPHVPSLRHVEKRTPHLVVRPPDTTIMVPTLRDMAEVEDQVVQPTSNLSIPASAGTSEGVRYCEGCPHYTASEFGTFHLCARSGAEIHPNHIRRDTNGTICSYHD